MPGREPVSRPRRVRWRASRRRRRRRLAALVLIVFIAAASPLLLKGLKPEVGPLQTLRNATAGISQPDSRQAQVSSPDSGGPADESPATNEDGRDEASPSPAAAAYAAVAPELPGIKPESVGGTFQSVDDPSWAVVSLKAPHRKGSYAVYTERVPEGWKARRSVLANQPDYPEQGRAALVGLSGDLRDALYPERTPEPAPSAGEEAKEFVSESPYFGEDYEPVSIQASDGYAKARIENSEDPAFYTHAYLRREAGSWSVSGLGQELTAAELPDFPQELLAESELPDAGPATVPVPEPVLNDVPDDRHGQAEDGMKEVRETVEEYEGVAGVYVRKPGEPGGYGIRSDERFYAASVIKVPVMAAVYRRVEEGDLSLNETVAATGEDYAGGAGWLQWQDPAASYTIEDYLWMMITKSDNVATNVLIRAVGGPEYVNETAREFGAEDTELQHKVTDQHAATASLDNYTTPRDMADMLAAIASGEAASEARTGQMLGLLRQNEAESWATQGLPPRTGTACKGGWLDGVYNDLCLVSGEEGEPYIISVFSKYGPPQVAEGVALNREISSEVWRIQDGGKEDGD